VCRGRRVQQIQSRRSSACPWSHRRRQQRARPARFDGDELGFEREKGGANAERRKGAFPRPTAICTVAVDLLQRGCSATVVGLQLHGGEFLGSERKGKGNKWAAEGCSRGVRAFNGLAWSWCRVHFGGEDWAMQAVLLERRRELGPGTRSDRTVVLCCGCSVVRFSAGAGKMARAAACPVGQGPGRGLRRDGCTMPCSCVCGVVQTVVCARGNAHAGLDMPRRRRARAGQGHGVAYGGSGRQRSIG
jgi:hypothetical protein